jgi:drug/metabolite transporter (DMT)-like permease
MFGTWPMLMSIYKITHPLGMLLVTFIACIPFAYFAYTTPIDPKLAISIQKILLIGGIAGLCNMTGLLMYPTLLEQDMASLYIIIITTTIPIFTLLISYILRPDFSIDGIQIIGVLVTIAGVLLISYKELLTVLQPQ